MLAFVIFREYGLKRVGEVEQRDEEAELAIVESVGSDRLTSG